MNGLQLLPVFLVGLAGSVHCVGMCGGIVGALSASAPARPVIAIASAPAATAVAGLANLMLVALGLYLMDAWRGLARLEQGGQLLWRRIQPLLKPFLPADSAAKALALGGLWGWLPCGMVYSVLLTAMLSGSAASGAAVMLAFGLGTLPMLLSLGLLGARLRTALQRRPVRLACGLLVLAFGLLGLLRAANGVSLGWVDALCLTGHP